MAYYIQGPRSAKYHELVKQYTMEHCKELLDADPEACFRLFQISQEAPVKKNYVRRKAKPPLLSKAAKV